MLHKAGALWKNHSTFVKLGFTKVSQVEQEVLPPCKGRRGPSLIPLGDRPFLLPGPRGAGERAGL